MKILGLFCSLAEQKSASAEPKFSNKTKLEFQFCTEFLKRKDENDLPDFIFFAIFDLIKNKLQ